jgi:hypothetical protein
MWALSAFLFLIWLLSHPWFKRLFEPADSVPPAPAVQPNINISPTISPVITVAPNIAASQTSSITLREPRNAHQPEPYRPNIIFRRAAPIKVYVRREGGVLEFVQGADNELPDAIIACFRNEPDMARRVREADYVTAQIIYRNAGDEEIEDGVPSACWIQNHFETINFAVGETHCLLLGIIDAEGLVVPWKHRQREWNGDSIVTNDKTFKGVSSIEVRLIGDNNELLLRPVTFDFSIVEGQPRVAKRADS